MGTNTTPNTYKRICRKGLSRIVNQNENCILIDYFAASTRRYTPEKLIEHLGLSISSFTQTYGFYGYADRLYFGGISVHYNLKNDNEQNSVLLEMSGQGCRQFETSSNVGFMQIFCEVSNGDFNITRLDIAYDDIDHTGNGLLDIGKIARYTLHQRFVTKWGGGTVMDSFRVSGNNEPMVHALTVQFGSRQSKILLRIYDKAQERGGFDYHWIRAEIVFKRERAAAFIGEVLNGKPIGEIYAGVLLNYLRFIKLDHSRKERCTIVKWWEQFLNYAEKIRLFSPKTVDYNLERVKNYVLNQAGNCIDTYIACVGEHKFMSDLKSRKTHLNDNQIRVIEEYRESNKRSDFP